MVRPLKSSDLLTLRTVSDVQVSADGRLAAWVLTDVVPAVGDPEAAGGKPYTPPRYRSRVHLRPLEGLGRRRPTEFTRGEYADRSPRFSPTGDRLAFLRTGEAGAPAQLHVMPVGGGEPERLTSHKAGVAAFAWAPDGKRIAYLSLGEHDDLGAKNGQPRRITRRYWRGDGVGVVPSTTSQLYVLNLAKGESRKVTDLHESPRLMAFAPGGAAVWLAVPAGERSAGEFRADIALLDLKTGTASVRVEDVVGLSSLQPSPDGAWLAYTASQRQDDVAAEGGVWLLDARGPRAKPRLLSGEVATPPSAGGDSRFGAYPFGPAWSEDGSALTVLVNAAGASGLARLTLDGALQPLADALGADSTSAAKARPGTPTAGKSSTVGTASIAASGRVVTAFAAPTTAGGVAALFIAETPDTPGEVNALLADGREVRLSHANDAWRKRLELATPAGPFTAGDAEAQFWVLEPAKPRKDGAAVVEVHGGPHTNYGYGFQLEFQLLAARGYAVIFGNPRGSSSYGHTFATSMLGRYGSVDADDVMAFAEAGAARLGRKKTPLHLTGGSYGGFMTNWLVGQTTRFRSAVTQRSICNWTSMYGTSDIGPWFVERELAGVPWGDVEALWRQSPIRYADKIETPLLIVHSEEDYRCPIEQAEQLFAVLKHLGKAETELFRVPGEGHELSRSGRPDRRVARLEAIVGWFEAHP